MEAWSHGAAAANSNRLACSTPSSLPPPLYFLLRAAGLQRWGTPAREYRRDFPCAQLPSPAPYLSLPARADPSPFPRARCLLFPLRALRGLLRACFFPPRGPALDLGGRLGVHPTPWRRLSAQGDAIRRNGVAGRTPPLGSRLDALPSPRRRRENHDNYAKHPITGSESHSRSYLSRKKRISDQWIK